MRVSEIDMEHLPELRRQAEDHCGDPGAAGDREDPHAPGSPGPGTAVRASPWPGAASGLTVTVQATRQSGPLESAASEGLRGQRKRPDDEGQPANGTRRETIFGGAVKPRQFSATFRDRLTRVGCGVRGAMGKEKGRLKILSLTSSSGRRALNCHEPRVYRAIRLHSPTHTRLVLRFAR